MSSSSQSPNFTSQGNLWHGSHIRKDWAKTNFSEREQPAEFFRVTYRFSETFTQRMLQHLFLKEIETTCLLKRDLN